jgi:hypothetical protein
MSSFSINVVLVRDEVTGEVDEAATTQAFQMALSRYKAQRELEDTTIGSNVHAAFDQYPGVFLPMESLISGVVQALNPTPENFSVLKEKVTAYIHDNADRQEKKDRKSGEVIQLAEPPRTRAFGIRRGKGGGICRWSDVKEKAEK